jgi:streptogramin lyase
MDNAINENLDKDEALEASPFGQFLFSQRNGLTHTELSDALAKVSEAVLANGGTGTITLKITVTQLGHENRLVVKDQVDVKAPKPVRESSIWFYNEGQRGLTRKDPNQGELALAAPIPLRPRLGTAIAVDRSGSDRTTTTA